MPYRDSLGQPAGYGGTNMYGPLQIEDMHPVLNEPVENPVTDADMYAMDPVFQPPMGQQATPMGPQMGLYQGGPGGGHAALSSMELRQMMQHRIREREASRHAATLRFNEKTQKMNM